MKKSYAQVAIPTNHLPPSGPNTPARSGTSVDSVASSGQQTPRPESAVSEDQSTSVPQVQQSVNHKTVLKEELDRLENSLASLKDVPGLEDCKSQLESKIKE